MPAPQTHPLPLAHPFACAKDSYPTPPPPSLEPMFARRLLLALLPVALALPGCIDRRITITSEPPGAIVWLNDVELGRTPITTRFTWYGHYDVRLRLEGHEPIATNRGTRMPIYEVPPIDLVASALPIGVRRHWHFELAPLPVPSPEAEAQLLDRAREFRGQLN
jgi:hypothetical protein